MSLPAEFLDFQCPGCRYKFHLDNVTELESVPCPDCEMEVPVPRFETLRGERRPQRAAPQEPPPSVPRLPVTVSQPAVGAGRPPEPKRPLPPPMPVQPSAWKQLRQHLMRTFFESRTGMVLLLGAVGLGGAGAWWAWQASELQRHEGMVNAAWNDADVAFRQGQFDVAEKEYRRVMKRAKDWGSRGLPHAELAGRMRELSSHAKTVNASLEKQTGTLDQDAFAELSGVVTELLGDQPVPMPGAENEEDGEEWSTVWSEEYQRHYYVHNTTQATAWELPS